MEYNNYMQQTQYKNYTHWYYPGEGQEEAGHMVLKLPVLKSTLSWYVIVLITNLVQVFGNFYFGLL